MVSLYVANEEGTYKEADTIPESGYTLNTQQSYCGLSNNGEIIKDDTVSIVYENGQVNVLGITKKGTKCYLYFDEKTISASDSILANYPTVLTRDDFSTTLTNTTTGTIYKSLDETQYDNDGEVYYFAGNPTDNWIYFGRFYWRIVKINGDGSIRLIYSGDSSSGPVTTGTSTQIGTSAFNLEYNKSYYVSLSYNNTQHGLGIKSTILTKLEEWYNTNLLDKEIYIDKETGFCSDRSTATGYTWNAATNRTINYAPLERTENANPTLKCNDNNDVLKIPVGLITIDEVVYAGGVHETINSSYYLSSGLNYWTMSPESYYYNDYNSSAFCRVFNVWGSGNSGLLNALQVSNDLPGVRPVINLKDDTQFIGTGTSTDPYQVVGSS